MMKYLYKNDEKLKLQNRSAAGKKYKGEQKLEISLKKSTMQQMLNLRLKYEFQNASHSYELTKRMNKLNKLIWWAIHNIFNLSK